jgi:membrane protease YdiL (CAAX protease family)
MSFLAAALLTIGAQLAMSAVVSLTEAARPGAVSDLVNLTACELCVHLGFVFVVARLYARETSLRHLLALRAVSPLVLVLVIVAGLAFEMPVSFVERAWAVRFPLTDAEQAHASELLTADTTAAKAVLAVCFVGLLPLGQELFYRGALFGRLRVAQDPRTTTFALAAFYALSTVASPASLPSAAALGIGLTAVRAGTGSTWASLAAYVAFMASAVFRLLRGPHDEALTWRHAVVAGAVGAVAMAILASRLLHDEVAVIARSRDGS